MSTNNRDASAALSHWVPIHEENQIGEARRAAVVLAERIGMNETLRGRAAIVATEAARNIWQHAGAGGGDILLQVVPEEGAGDTPPMRLDILAIDRGPGMADISACFRDGYSTGGTAGQGLGAIQRLADDFDIYAPEGQGTALYAGLRSVGPPNPNAPHWQVGAVNVPKAGETACGDSWSVEIKGTLARCIVADGLGHGPIAQEASLLATEIFETTAGLTLPEQMSRIHVALRSTRGAAISIALADSQNKVLRFVGVGNVSGAIARNDDASIRMMVCHNGTVGAQIHKIQEFLHPFPEQTTLLLASDGLTAHWKLERYPGILSRHPALIAAIMYRDYTRGRDDATVVVLRRREPTEAAE